MQHDAGKTLCLLKTNYKQINNLIKNNMKKFTLTKQLFAAALVVAMSFTGCQKSEMEDVSPLRVSNSQEVITGACGTSKIYELRRINNDDVVIGTVEINNTSEDLIIKFSTVETTILQVQARVNGQEITLNNKGKNAEITQTLPIRVDKADYYLIENLGMKAGTMGHQSNKILEAGSTVVIPRGEFSTEWTWSTCVVANCGLDQAYWKALPSNEWPISSLTLGKVTFNASQLRDILLLSSDRKAVKLASDIILASLTVAVINDPNDGLSIALEDAIKTAKAILTSNNVEVLGTGADIKQSDVPGQLTGQLKQLVPCE